MGKIAEKFRAWKQKRKSKPPLRKRIGRLFLKNKVKTAAKDSAVKLPVKAGAPEAKTAQPDAKKLQSVKAIKNTNLLSPKEYAKFKEEVWRANPKVTKSMLIRTEEQIKIKINKLNAQMETAKAEKNISEQYKVLDEISIAEKAREKVEKAKKNLFIIDENY